MLAKIERFVYFPVVRMAAFIGAFILFLAMVGGLIFIVTFDARARAKQTIAFSQVRDTINSEDPEQIDKQLKQIKVPQNVKRYFGEEAAIMFFFEGWFDAFKTVKDKNAFLVNLSQIITEAEKNDPRYVYEYIDTFRELKMEQNHGIEIFGTELNLKQYIDPVIRAATIGTTIYAILFLFALFTLVILLLLLLSIERNTRRES